MRRIQYNNLNLTYLYNFYTYKPDGTLKNLIKISIFNKSNEGLLLFAFYKNRIFIEKHEYATEFVDVPKYSNSTQVMDMKYKFRYIL